MFSEAARPISNQDEDNTVKDWTMRKDFIAPSRRPLTGAHFVNTKSQSVTGLIQLTEITHRASGWKVRVMQKIREGDRFHQGVDLRAAQVIVQATEIRALLRAFAMLSPMKPSEY